MVRELPSPNKTNLAPPPPLLFLSVPCTCCRAALVNRPAEIALIAAVARNGAIGRDNALLFNEPADQRHFRAATLGCPVIMGRRTWDSLPGASGRCPAAATSSSAAMLRCKPRAPSLPPAWHRRWPCGRRPRAFVIGGAQLYAQALPLADTLVLTEIDADLDGDTHFPVWDRNQFVERSSTAAVTAAGVAYRFVTYDRRPHATAGP